MLDKMFENVGLEAPPKPREFIIPPVQLKSEFRSDTGLPTDFSELFADLGLPRSPKEAIRRLGLPELSELAPGKIFKSGGR